MLRKKHLYRYGNVSSDKGLESNHSVNDKSSLTIVTCASLLDRGNLIKYKKKSTFCLPEYVSVNESSIK